MARKQFRREWPGDPHAAWQQAARALASRSLPRPELPQWRDFDVFTRQVSLPPATPSPFGTVGAGLFFALCAWLKDFRGFFGIGLAVLAAVLVLAGFYFLWLERARHQQRVRRIHGRCLAHGVGCHAYRTSYAYIWAEGNGTETTTSLLIDERLPGDDAVRLQQAVRIWLARVLANPGLKAQVVKVHENRYAVPTSEIFGPQASGGWLTVDQGADDTPWRLLIDRPDGVREYLYDEILVVRGQQGRLYLDEPRHDRVTDGFM
ncbi:hypothetical protein [Mycolicibacterium goodii]|uniref:Uncharacterized protein n=1 Tax=Mycolicibacterium goodii TaxID=134601 RepID=A0A0K0XDW4_MYCGD|nr:hypothetical protein AFA91_30985 [Mycolicibacterium goodii]